MTNAVAVALPSHSAQRALRVVRPILRVAQAVSPDLAAAEFAATDGLRHRGVLRDAAVISRVLEFATAQRPAHDVIARETAPE